MRVQVLGDGILANTTRDCCVDYHELVDVDPDVLWVCVEPFHWDWQPAPLTLISSPALVGTCAELQRRYPDVTFAVSPENIRYAAAVDDFMNQARIVIGGTYDDRLHDLLSPFCRRILWMSPESAEMVKHAVNGYLAMCVRFGNELGTLCELHGADPGDVLTGLLTERRVSGFAPLAAGPPPSDHLMREVANLIALGGGPLMQALA